MIRVIKPLVFVIEDNEGLAKILEYNLQNEGYRTSIMDDGDKAWYQIKHRFPDLIVLDWHIPTISGIELCKLMRSHQSTENIPIIMISTKGQDFDKITAFASRVDDYLVKPFSPQELIARIKSILYRTKPSLFAKKLYFEDIVLDLSRNEVICNNVEAPVSPTEFQILQLFFEQPNAILSRKYLRDKIWGNDVYVEERTIDVHITRLRKALMKVRKTGDNYDIIRTVRLNGYSLRHRNGSHRNGSHPSGHYRVA